MPERLSAAERIEIERACERLVYVYSRALDLGDMSAAADCFAENGSMARPMMPDAVIQGRGVAYAVGLYAQDEGGRDGVPVREDRTRHAVPAP